MISLITTLKIETLIMCVIGWRSSLIKYFLYIKYGYPFCCWLNQSNTWFVSVTKGIERYRRVSDKRYGEILFTQYVMYTFHVNILKYKIFHQHQWKSIKIWIMKNILNVLKEMPDSKHTYLYHKNFKIKCSYLKIEERFFYHQ